MASTLRPNARHSSRSATNSHVTPKRNARLRNTLHDIGHPQSNYRLAHMSSTDIAEHLRDRYLTLLQRALTHTLYWPIDIDWSNDHKKTDAVLTESVAKDLADPEFDWAK